MQPSDSAYRPDIDGLRAVAVLSVVAFHAFPARAPGGFACGEPASDGAVERGDGQAKPDGRERHCPPTVLARRAATRGKRRGTHGCARCVEPIDSIVTEIVPLEKFWPAERYHQDYFRLNPNQGYCQFVIAPKIRKLEKEIVGEKR